MVDYSLSPGSGPPSWPDWPQEGYIRTLLSTRVERTAKEFLRRIQPTPVAEPAAGFDVDPVYRLAASPQPMARAAVLADAFRAAVEPSQAVDVTLAALALAIAAGDRPRAEGLATFLELCYRPSDLDGGAARMGARMAESGAASNPAFAGLEYHAGWPALAAGVRQHILSMAQLRSRPERRLGCEVVPRRVVVRISGGLGNQLFQYAAALAYARRTRTPLRLDLASYEGRGWDREFLLGRLRVPVRRANSYEVLHTRLRAHFETRGALDEFMFGNHGSAWLCGFWEDNAYFGDIVPTVRRRFRPRNQWIAEAARDLVRRARGMGGPVVGVHLRRGDRGPGGRAFSPFSSLPTGYFRQAASRFPQGANYLVLSDTPQDIAWCRHHLGLGDDTKVTFGEGRDPVLDMFALTECDHVILSSGTFSWWAGYLGDRPGRRVIAPNPLQALSAAQVMIPWPMPLQPGWEEVTLPRGSLGVSGAAKHYPSDAGADAIGL